LPAEASMLPQETRARSRAASMRMPRDVARGVWTNNGHP
jgi:hypothetical protein